MVSVGITDILGKTVNSADIMLSVESVDLTISVEIRDISIKNIDSVYMMISVE